MAKSTKTTAKTTKTQAAGTQKASTNVPKRRAKIDMDKPYGTVHGITDAKFEQDGKLFGSDGLEVGSFGTEIVEGDDNDPPATSTENDAPGNAPVMDEDALKALAAA